MSWWPASSVTVTVTDLRNWSRGMTAAGGGVRVGSSCGTWLKKGCGLSGRFLGTESASFLDRTWAFPHESPKSALQAWSVPTSLPPLPCQSDAKAPRQARTSGFLSNGGWGAYDSHGLVMSRRHLGIGIQQFLPACTPWNRIDDVKKQGHYI